MQHETPLLAPSSRRLTHAASIFLGWITLAAGAMGGMTTGTERLVLDRMAEAGLGDSLPPGWDRRTVSGFGTPKSRVTAETGNEEIDRAIRFEAHGPQAAFFGLELRAPLDPASQRLRWYWRVDESVPGAKLRAPDRDDSPARFFVVFGRGGVFSSPRILFYSWGGSDEIGDHWTYRDDGNFRVMVLRNETSPTRVWLLESRDLRADYLLTFGSEPPPVTAVGFMIDTDQTGATASSRLGPIEAHLHRSSRTARTP